MINSILTQSVSKSIKKKKKWRKWENFFVNFLKFTFSNYQTDVQESSSSINLESYKQTQKSNILAKVKWNSTNDANLLAINFSNIPNLLWIWNVEQMRYDAVIVQQSAIKDFCWDPKKTRLAFTCDKTSLYLWNPAGCSIVQLPSKKPRSRK